MFFPEELNLERERDWYVNKSIFITEEKNYIQGSRLKGGSFQLRLTLLEFELRV